MTRHRRTAPRQRVPLVGVVTANVAAYFVESEQSDDLYEIRSQLERIEALLVASQSWS